MPSINFARLFRCIRQQIEATSERLPGRRWGDQAGRWECPTFSFTSRIPQTSLIVGIAGRDERYEGKFLWTLQTDTTPELTPVWELTIPRVDNRRINCVFRPLVPHHVEILHRCTFKVGRRMLSADEFMGNYEVDRRHQRWPVVVENGRRRLSLFTVDVQHFAYDFGDFLVEIEAFTRYVDGLKRSCRQK